MNYKCSIKWRERGGISSPALCTLVVIPLLPSTLKDGEFPAGIELRGEKRSRFSGCLCLALLFAPRHSVETSLSSPELHCQHHRNVQQEKRELQVAHFLLFKWSIWWGGGFPSDFVIKFISWFRPFMSAFQLKTNVCEHVQRQRNKFNVEQSPSP